MNFEVVINGRGWKIGVEPGEQHDTMRVMVNGRTRTMRTAWVDRNTLSLIAVDEGGSAQSHEAGLRNAGNGDFEISLNGTILQATVARASDKPRRPVSELQARSGARTGARNLVAPMPGRVIRVLVAQGDRVSAGQGVVVIEAMKMENELRSPTEGIVKQIAVQQESAIEAGALLAVIEPCL